VECLGKTAVDGVESVHPGNFVVVEEKMLARHHKFKMMVEPRDNNQVELWNCSYRVG
jgi:hypothetical protein